jgi:hypothetical protein
MLAYFNEQQVATGIDATLFLEAMVAAADVFPDSH